jgi:hypothetical protein
MGNHGEAENIRLGKRFFIFSWIVAPDWRRFFMLSPLYGSKMAPLFAMPVVDGITFAATTRDCAYWVASILIPLEPPSLS